MLGIHVACTVGSEERIFRALFRPNSETHFVSAGVKHLKFWSVAGNTFVEKKAVINKAADGGKASKMQTMLAIAFGPVRVQASISGERNASGSSLAGRSNLHRQYDRSGVHLESEYTGTNDQRSRWTDLLHLHFREWIGHWSEREVPSS